jgi:predicted XRE-type DNA-binding protein
MKISKIIEKRHLSQTQVAAILGIPQPKVSMIQHGKLRLFFYSSRLFGICKHLKLLIRSLKKSQKTRFHSANIHRVIHLL